MTTKTFIIRFYDGSSVDVKADGIKLEDGTITFTRYGDIVAMFDADAVLGFVEKL